MLGGLEGAVKLPSDMRLPGAHGVLRTPRISRALFSDSLSASGTPGASSSTRGHVGWGLDVLFHRWSVGSWPCCVGSAGSLALVRWMACVRFIRSFAAELTFPGIRFHELGDVSLGIYCFAGRWSKEIGSFSGPHRVC